MELLKIKGQSQKVLLSNHSAASKHSISSSVASNASIFSETPPPKSSLTQEVAKIVRKEGLGGIYKGFGPTMLRDVPFSMVYFPLFAHLNHMNLNQDGTSKPLWSLVAGVGAGAFSAWLFTPLDCMFGSLGQILASLLESFGHI